MVFIYGLAFTRTLTIIYSTTLLTILTTVQLNIIGRSKYLQSIIQLHREEKLRERRIFQASVSSLFFGGLPDLDEDLDADLQDVSLVSEETELRFLTLSWWLLYVGWKDVGERVRRSVEEVFERYCSFFFLRVLDNIINKFTQCLPKTKTRAHGITQAAM